MDAAGSAEREPKVATVFARSLHQQGAVVQTREGQGDQHRSLWTLPVKSAGGPFTRSTISTRSTIANVERVELVERVEPATEAGTEPTAIGTMAEARRSVISTGTVAA